MDLEVLNKESSSIYQSQSRLRHPFSLPLEVWVEIFILSLPSIDVAQAPHKTSLSLVCRFWNTIIESTPILWSRITILDQISYVQKSLSKSSECAIDVNGVRSIPGATFGHPCDGICCQFLQQVRLHSKRWRRVVLPARCCEKFAPLTALPLLESIKLHLNYRPPVYSQFTALLGRKTTPNLREVILHATHLPRWDISFSSNLLKLEIYNISSLGPLSTELLSILAACPNLTDLRLCKVVPRLTLSDHGVENSPSTPSTVELTALRKLKLSRNSVQLVQDLLLQLRLPEECAISVTCAIPGTSPSTSFLTPVLARFNSDFQRASGIHQTKVIYTGHRFRFIVIYQRWYVQLNMTEIAAIQDAIRWFGIGSENGDTSAKPETGPALNQIPISLKFTDKAVTDMSSLHPTGIFNLECITRLKTTRVPNDQQTLLLQYLSRPEHPDGAATKNGDQFAVPGAYQHTPDPWVFPGLCDLVVKAMREDVVEAAIEVAKGRSGGSATGRGPARLKRIEFVDEHDKAIGNGETCSMVRLAEAQRNLLPKLLDILGDDAKVFWGGKRVSKTGVMD